MNWPEHPDDYAEYWGAFYLAWQLWRHHEWVALRINCTGGETG